MQKSSKSLLVFGGVLAIFIVGYFFVYGQWIALGDAKTAFEISEQENQRLKKAQSDITNFLSKYNSNRTEAEKANRALPMGNDGIPEFLDNLSKMAKESGMALKSINIVQVPGSAEAAGPRNTIKPLDADVEVSGTYEAFENYLLRIQRSLRITDIVTINVSSESGEGRDARNLKFSLTLRTYYQE